MILGALVDYYERRAADPDSGIAPRGWELKPLPFIVEIDPSGGFVQVVDTREPDGPRLRARRFLVPQTVKRTVAILPNLLWDSAEYALGIDVRGNPERVRRQHQAFIDLIVERFGASPDDDGLSALLRFLDAVPFERLESQSTWPEILEANPFISFRLAGDAELICRRDRVKTRVVKAAGAADGLCLVTGERTAIARLHPSIKGVRGATTMGASLVSFNLAAFESYGQHQGANAPIGEEAAFAYTTALNDLLSRQRLTLADSAIVYWAERADATDVELAFASVIADPSRDDPLAGSKAVEAVLSSLHSGVPITGDDSSRFYVMAISPNAARLSIREIQVTTISELASRIESHHRDLEIVMPPFVPRYPSLARLLNATAIQGKADNVPPNLAGDVIRAVISGSPYPTSLLQAAVRRVRASARDRFDPLPLLASAIKASLNREARARRIHDRKELTVALDPDNPSVAYRLGRLFALLERAQEMATDGTLNATIRDRFYGAASASPVTVFSRLLTLKNHHVAKLARPSDRVWIERQIGEVMSGIATFPSHLDLNDQGLFAIGYYHQRQSFYTKRAETVETPAQETIA